jgi:hypothetical protein
MWRPALRPPMSPWAPSCSTLRPSWSATHLQSYLQHCSCVAVRKAIINPTLSGFIDYSQEAISQLHSQYGSLCYKVLIIFLAARLIESYNKDRLVELEFSNIRTNINTYTLQCLALSRIAYIQIIYKTSVNSPHKTHSVSISKIINIILLGILSVFIVTIKRNTQIHWGQIKGFLTLQQVVHMVTTVFLNS